MTERKQIYKCSICGNIVEVLHPGHGELVCCNKPMDLIQTHTKDLGFEKHVPVFEQKGEKIFVKVGETPHPMEKDHFIEWIEIVFKNGKSCKIFLKPEISATAEFVLDGEIEEVREYCNLHGLWSNRLSD